MAAPLLRSARVTACFASSVSPGAGAIQFAEDGNGQRGAIQFLTAKGPAGAAARP